jgi:hypothetical protein
MILPPTKKAESNPAIQVRMASLPLRHHRVALVRYLTLLSPKETTATTL